MPEIEFACPRCAKVFQDDVEPHDRMKCSACGQRFKIPGSVGRHGAGSGGGDA